MIVDPLKHVQKIFEVDPSFGAKVMRLFVFAYCETPPGLKKFSKNRIFFWSYMLLDSLKHVQKNFEVDPSFGSKVMRLFVFAYCETPPALRKISIQNFFSFFFLISFA